MKHSILTLAAIACLILSFQNCAKPLAVIDPTLPGGGADSTAQKADHDPLKTATEEAGGEGTEFTNGITPPVHVGRLYQLEAVDDNGREVSLAGRGYSLQFSSTFPDAGTGDVAVTVLKQLSFTARAGCTAVYSGRGEMSRFGAIPLRAGALLLRVTSGSAVSCQLAETGTAKFGAAEYKNLLDRSAQYVIVGQRLFLTTGDGVTAIFKAVSEGEAPPVMNPQADDGTPPVMNPQARPPAVGY